VRRGAILSSASGSRRTMLGHELAPYPVIRLRIPKEVERWPARFG
jgi:hypothetical protein